MQQIKATRENDERIEWLEDNYDDEDEDVSLEYYHYRIGSMHKFYSSFPNILRSSLLIAVYSFFETSLVNLCKELNNTKKYSVRYNSIAGKGIEKVKLYLTEVVEIDFPSGSIEWSKINDYRLIRNCFAHGQGKVTDDNRSLISAIKRLDSVRVTGDVIFGRYIELEKEFINNFIEVIELFWSKIENQYLDILYPHL